MLRRLKVYIVDDAMELCQDLRGWLSQTGHEVTCAPAGQTTIQILQEYQPHLIVLGMARYAGEELAMFRKLTSHRQLRQVPLLVASDDASLEYEMLDVFDFQVRPFDRERLQVCLKRLAGSRKYLAGVSFAEPELTAIKRFLREHSGLHFSQHNQRILEQGLMRRIQALRMESLPAYFNYLTAATDNYDEINKLLGLLTIGETSFFRYRSHREALLHDILPKLVEQNRSQGRLRIWSAGCSTGEEPYSLAILLREHFPELVDWDVQILATDINKRALRQARQGVYGERSLRMMEASLRQRYFQQVDDHFLLTAQVRRMVRFEYLNLQSDSFRAASDVSQGLDLLLCRNVLIYFELETIRRIVEKFRRALNPRGFLLLGHAETMQNVSDGFQRHHQHNAFFYQRKDAQGFLTSSAPTPVSPDHVQRESGPAVTVAPAETVDASATAGAVAAAESRPHEDGPKLPRPPEELYREAMTAFEHEQFARADTLFDQLLEQQPAHPQALIGKGVLLANLGQYSDARLLCARAIRVDDLLPEAYLLRGLILDMEGFLERALVEYQKVLWLAPEFVMAHYLAAKIHDRLADKEKNRRALRNTARALEQATGASTVPFSGGLSRGVFLEIVRRELAETLIP